MKSERYFGEDAWQKGIEKDLPVPSATASNCPICPQKPYEALPKRCICIAPNMIYIPNGGHIHIQCPVHGDHIIYGSTTTC
jgi:hypothetical protein